MGGHVAELMALSQLAMLGAISVGGLPPNQPFHPTVPHPPDDDPPTQPRPSHPIMTLNTPST